MSANSQSGIKQQLTNIQNKQSNKHPPTLPRMHTCDPPVDLTFVSEVKDGRKEEVAMSYVRMSSGHRGERCRV